MKRLIIVLSLLFSFNGWADNLEEAKDAAIVGISALLSKGKYCNSLAVDLQAIQMYKQKGFSMKEIFTILKPSDEARTLYEKAYNTDIPNVVSFSNGIYDMCMEPSDKLADKIKTFIKRL